ncbi:MAG: hypothetical protein QM728_12050 [Gordonia sp. (in: high G+C Gram-positive bacteria)]|uniref:hypothetical protein n=1 Tax=Gordonia sp. (in: high G+C Gram-positive bacteria) TaxID=84139 RepID=UPI0039E5702E
MMQRTRAIGVGLLAVGLTATGCGSNDKGADAGAGGDVKSSCAIAYGPATAVPGQLVSYRSLGDVNKLPISDASLNDSMLSLVKDPKLTEIAKRGFANGKAFNEALAKKDNAARDKAIVASRPILKDYESVCAGAMGSESVYQSLEEVVASGTLPQAVSGPAAPTAASSTTPSAPTSSKAAAPVVVTPPGAEVKVGQSVTIEAKTYGGETGKYTFTITAIDEAKGSDLRRIKPELREKIGTMLYIRAQLRPADEKAKASSMVSSTFDPQYLISPTDDTPAQVLTFFGDFKPCKDESKDGGKDFCTPISVTKGESLLAVAVKSFESGAITADTPLYTWKVK